jgi:hypothetical protein
MNPVESPMLHLPADWTEKEYWRSEIPDGNARRATSRLFEQTHSAIHDNQAQANQLNKVGPIAAKRVSNEQPWAQR